VLRILAGAGALILTVAGLWLGYIAIVAARRSEGVFLPAGYVAALCLVGAGLLARLALARA
jgi:hypothetical protein